MSAYSIVLTIHSWNRWAALLLGVAATLNAFLNRTENPAKPGRSRWDTFFMAAVDLQVLLGLVLYFGLSPVTTAGLNDLSEAIHSPILRFWVFFHIIAMFGGMLLVRVGRVLAMTGKTPDARRFRKGIAFAAALLVMAAAIPWPGTAAGRPLFRV
jgi:cytochrome bd-type quinol oxidase subunit 1